MFETDDIERRAQFVHPKCIFIHLVSVLQLEVLCLRFEECDAVRAYHVAEARHRQVRAGAPLFADVKDIVRSLSEAAVARLAAVTFDQRLSTVTETSSSACHSCASLAKGKMYD